MKTQTMTAVVMFATALCSLRAQGMDLQVAARVAMDASDEARASAAIAALREAGPRGLGAFLSCNREVGRYDVLTPEVQRFRSAVDRIGAQRDNHAARLYWFTDLERAKAHARAVHKPILSLRLLGRLDEELSCANSRFFRTALYANETVGRLLGDRFVLHWASERPAPRVTIDYGDGRKLERTITGNSIHYVLDVDGNVIDALPGLYGPAPFARELERVGNAFAALTEEARRAGDLAHAKAVLGRLRSGPARRELEASLRGSPRSSPEAGLRAIPADVAGMRAVSKLAPERPLLPVAMGGRVDVPPAFADSWVVPRPEDYLMDESSLRLLRSKVPPAVAADAKALERMVAAFERTMAVDTVRNDVNLRATILERLVSKRPPLPELNAWVYETVFLTPASDPWLGLSGDVYTGIEGGGIVENRGPVR